MRQAWPPVDNPPTRDDDAILGLYAPTGTAGTCLRINLVTSVDGAVSVDGYSAGLSGPADKRVFGILRTLCDALLVGAGTLRSEGYGPLALGPDRRARRAGLGLGLAEHPTLVVLSRRLALDPTHPCFTAAPVRPIVLTCAGSPRSRRAALARVADVIVAGDDTVDLPAGLAALHARGLLQILCEGGPQTFGALTAADLVDEVCLTVSPLLAGGEPGRLSAGPPVDIPRRMALAHLLVEDSVLLLRYVRPPTAAGDTPPARD